MARHAFRAAVIGFVSFVRGSPASAESGANGALPAPPPARSPARSPDYARGPEAPRVQDVAERRSVELAPFFGVAVPSCAEGSTANARCEGVAGGIGLGFQALWRITPHFALGGGFDAALFSFDPPADSELRDPGAGGGFLGLEARLYPLLDGPWDPFIALALGLGALGTSAREPAPTAGETGLVRYDETTGGGAVRLGVGFGFLLSSSVKLGPTLTYTRVFSERIRRCRSDGGAGCADRFGDEFGHIDSFLRVSAELTFMLGSVP